MRRNYDSYSTPTHFVITYSTYQESLRFNVRSYGLASWLKISVQGFVDDIGIPGEVEGRLLFLLVLVLILCAFLESFIAVALPGSVPDCLAFLYLRCGEFHGIGTLSAASTVPDEIRPQYSQSLRLVV